MIHTSPELPEVAVVDECSGCGREDLRSTLPPQPGETRPGAFVRCRACSKQNWTEDVTPAVEDRGDAEAAADLLADLDDVEGVNDDGE